MATKLNVIAVNKRGLWQSPRKVREEILPGSMPDGIRLYLADMWWFRYYPARPLKYRRGTSLVVVLPATGEWPEMCWEFTTCFGLPTKEAAAAYYASVCKDLLSWGIDDYVQRFAPAWEEGKWLHDFNLNKYQVIYQENHHESD